MITPSGRKVTTSEEREKERKRKNAFSSGHLLTMTAARTNSNSNFPIGVGGCTKFAYGSPSAQLQIKMSGILVFKVAFKHLPWKGFPNLLKGKYIYFCAPM